MKRSTVYLAGSIVLAVFFYLVIGSECEINFDKEALEITSLLVPYSILGLLIERFVNNFFIPQENTKLKNGLKALGEDTNGQALLTQEQEAEVISMEDDHNPKFVRYSFIVALFVSAIGFRFLAQITDGGSTDCVTSEWFRFDYNYLFDLGDIFLTAILLSGGSQAINKILQSLTKKTGV